jgi:hypothetical protein
MIVPEWIIDFFGYLIIDIIFEKIVIGKLEFLQKTLKVIKRIFGQIRK